ncbi:MFS transporter [Pseudonocardia oceani]|uniref:MFS transporter n=4 Tax=Pseudonocardia oceani TaxID=2792013 RepID=A0ABS6UGD1_9PSEU|nr:MFS transporter [Pseudonocardia oceani]MBW0120302.1 MFS transporter [Pseudonocardia oceani]MBW0130919.1 MFS transporter [Pseudonocardia oceani]
MSTPAGPARVPRPATVVGVSALAVGFGASPGFVLGFLAVPLQADLDLDRWQVGLLVGAFFGATGLGSIVGGRIAERVGPRRAVVADQLVVALALVTAALLPHYAVLLGAAVVAGAGYALTNAGTSIAIAAALPPHRHGVALAVRTAGVPLLVAVSAVVAAGSAELVGWRAVLGGYAPLLLLVAALALAVLPGLAPAVVGRAGPAPLPRRFGWFPLAAFALIAGSQALFSWMVPFLHEAGGVPLAAAGALTSTGSLAAIVGMVVLARRSDRAAAGGRLPAIVVLCLLVAGGQLLLVAGIPAGPPLMVAGLLVATVAQLAAISLMHAAVIAAAPGAVGRAAGVTMAGYYLGALAGPPLFGLLVDRTGGYGPAWLACAALVVAGAAGFWRCRRIVPVPAQVP